MPRRAPITHGRQAAGFTLIEVLVVVLIIGICLLFVSLSINPTSSADRLDTQAKRLNALASAAADDAMLFGDPIGIELTRHGYRFLRYGKRGWQPYTRSDSALHPRHFDKDIRLVQINAKRGKHEQGLFSQAQATSGDANQKNDDNEQQANRRPDVVFLPSGEIIPFTLELSANGVSHRYDLTGHANGKVSMKRIGH